MRITTGKPLDVLALKGSSLQEIREYAAHLATVAATAPSNGHVVCPICENPGVENAALIYGLIYHSCPTCSHVFVSEQVDTSQDPEIASTYTDPDYGTRMEQVVMPKFAWMLNVYHERFDADPQRIIDVGAGGGHFVYLAQQAGLDAVGYEISAPARDFAKETFDIDLIAEDFLEATDTADIVTFWGLLEYVPYPVQFLKAARQAGKLLVVEVPRWNSLSTAIQLEHPDIVARHLDPTSHVNIFTDKSLRLALAGTNFSLLAAWYFGMDSYELAVQLALRLGDKTLEPLVELLAPLQRHLDQTEFCDDIIVAAE